MVARVRRDHRVCRVLVWMALSIVAVEIGVGLLLDRPGLLLRFRFREARVRLEQLKATERQPDVVFLGSSRMEALPTSVVAQTLGVQPCNLAVGAGDMTTSAFMLEQVFREKVKPVLV